MTYEPNSAARRRDARAPQPTTFRRRRIIAIGAAVAVVVLVVGTIVFFATKADRDALNAYSNAEGDLQAAQLRTVEAQQHVVTLLDNAVAVAASATTLASSTGPGYVDDPATITAVGAASTALAEAAGLVVTDGVAAAPEVSPVEDLGTLNAPAGNDERIAAAAALTARVPAFDEATAAFTTQAEEITAAIETARTSMDAVISSAHTSGSTWALPPLASAETVAAYTAAVDALAAPVEDADPVALIAAYQDAWLAGIASHEAVARTQDTVSEPTLIRGILIANKTYALPSDYGTGLTAETSDAFASMKAAAAAQGLNLYISSGFRSYSTQVGLYNKYAANDGVAEADRYSARPGHSEHQTGLTFDLNTITEAFGSTPAGLWVAAHGHEYGFIVRYPQGGEAITGYKWEPWHMRFLGVDVATKVFNSGLTLEEYLGITSSY